MVHGDEGLLAAERITTALFSGDSAALGQSDLAQLAQDGLPSSQLHREEMPQTLTQLLAQAGVAGGKQLKDALAREAILINGEPVVGGPTVSSMVALPPERALYGRFYLVRFGKKKYHLLIDDA